MLVEAQDNKSKPVSSINLSLPDSMFGIVREVRKVFEAFTALCLLLSPSIFAVCGVSVSRLMMCLEVIGRDEAGGWILVTECQKLK